MIFNEPNWLSVNLVFKNADKFGGIPLACYSVNVSKRWECIILAQDRESQRHKIIRRYEVVAFKNVHTDVPHLSSKISNKKQSP